jgi:hypothetical protein
VVSFIESKVHEANQSSAPVQLSDTNGHWAEKTIETFIKLGVVRGYENGAFKPESSMTRAEFATILTRVFDIQGGTKTDATFSDTKGHWAKDAILKLAQAGIINGYEDSTFHPNKTVSREEMVIMVSRILKLDSVSKDSTKGNFSDLTNSYAATEIKDAAEAGIISGEVSGKFDPKSNSTRAEALTLILNALKLDPQIKNLLDSLN